MESYSPVMHDSTRTCMQVNTEVQNLAIDNNDDRIMHCCLVYQYKIRTKSKSVGVIIIT